MYFLKVINVTVPVIILTFLTSSVVYFSSVIVVDMHLQNKILSCGFLAFVILMIFTNWFMLIYDDQHLDIVPQEEYVSNGNTCACCKKVKGINMHHCPVCEKCIPYQDHHCFFFATCIHLTNMKHFMIVLFYSNVGCAYLLVAMLLHLRSGGSGFLHNWHMLFMPVALYHLSSDTIGSDQVLVSCIFTGASAFWLATLVFFMYQFNLIAKGNFYFALRKTDRKNNRSLCKNLVAVFGEHYVLVVLCPFIYQKTFRRILFGRQKSSISLPDSLRKGAYGCWRLVCSFQEDHLHHKFILDLSWNFLPRNLFYLI